MTSLPASSSAPNWLDKLEVKIGSSVVLMTQALRQPGNEAKNGAGEEMQSTLLRGEWHLPHGAASGRRQHHSAAVARGSGPARSDRTVR